MSSFYTAVRVQGAYVLCRGYENGIKFNRKIKYKPSLFLEGGDGETPYRNLAGNPVYKKTFPSCWDAREFTKKYADVAGFQYFGMEMFEYTFIRDNFPKKIEYDPDLIAVANIDIEVKADEFPLWTNPVHPITAITVKIKNRIISLGLGDFVPTDPRCIYIKCSSEEEMLDKFLQVWERYMPDVITGWNTEEFDIPYLIGRIRYIFGENAADRLSPWGRIYMKREWDHKTKQHKEFPTISGIASLDYMKMYKNQKFQQPKPESYSLDVVAHEVLGKNKLDYSDYENLNDLHKRNFQLYMEYNVRDVLLVDELDQQLNLIPFCFSMAYKAKINFEDVLGSVRQWEVIIYNYLIEQGIVVPAKKYSDKDDLEGGYVREVEPGLKGWGVSFDLDGLYPHLIMQLNLSPETYVGQLIEAGALTVEDVLEGKLEQFGDLLRERNVSVAANMALYTKEKRGFFPELMEFMYAERKAAKKAMLKAEDELQHATDETKAAVKRTVLHYDLEQKGVKVNMNAAYGCLTSPSFRFFSNPNAAAITATGRVVINWLIARVNTYLNKICETEGVDYVIAADTDSMYLNFETLVKKVFGDKEHDRKDDKIIKFIDKFCEEHLTPHIKTACEDFCFYMNSFEQKMSMKRENIFDRAVWVAKKMYVLNVWDKEGVRYEKPKILIKGLQAVKSDTPLVCRKHIKETIGLIMGGGDEDSVIDYVENFRSKFDALPFEDIATPKGCNGLEKYADAATIYKKGTGANVKGALIYNHLLKEKGIRTFEPIHNGNKIKYAYLRVPNPIHQEVISCPRMLPKEFGLEDYIDKDRLFESGYLNPVKKITDVIGWKTKRVASVDGFLS